jgi:hypothetical protein
MWWWRDSGSIRNFGFAPKPAVGARNADSPVVGQSVLTFWHEIQDFCNTLKRPRYKAKAGFLTPTRAKKPGGATTFQITGSADTRTPEPAQLFALIARNLMEWG